VNTGPLNVREIEALTFIGRTPATPAAGERIRWTKLFNRAWATLRKRTRRPSASSSAADWTFPGL